MHWYHDTKEKSIVVNYCYPSVLLLEPLVCFIGVFFLDPFLAASWQRSAVVAGTMGEKVVMSVARETRENKTSESTFPRPIPTA
jgi:hypothetical protein